MAPKSLDDAGRTRRRSQWTVLAILIGFVIASAWSYARGRDDSSGDDLSASYVAARLIATGHTDRLYSHDPADFSIVHDPEWEQAAEQGGFDGFLHPYVQTPAWAYLLQPLAMRVDFPTFNAIFSVLMAICFASLLWSVAAAWAPSLLTPIWMGPIAMCLFFSVPFSYAMYLTQTHVLFLLLTVLALVRADRDAPISAGILLAVAAAVKITPAFLLVYWLLLRRWRASISMLVTSAILLLLTLVATGRAAILGYLEEVHRISGLLLVAYNNQSFAAWLMAHWYPQAEFMAWHSFVLPRFVQWASLLLLLGSLLLGGLWDRQRKQNPPLGAIFALVAATVFTPLAWSHYSIVLLIPLMVLLGENLRFHSRWIAASLVIITALNFRPWAMDATNGVGGPLTIMRSHFFACVLCLATIALVHMLSANPPDTAILTRFRKLDGSAPGS